MKSMPKIKWGDVDASSIGALRDGTADPKVRKFLECMQLLRLGYKVAQVVDMTKTPPAEIFKFIQTWNRRAEKGYTPPVVKEKPAVAKAKFPRFTAAEGCLFLLRMDYRPANRRVWQTLFKAYLKRSLPAEDAASEIMAEMKMNRMILFSILKEYDEGSRVG